VNYCGFLGIDCTLIGFTLRPMPFAMLKNRSIAWIAFAAILLSALAPTVSRGLAASSAVPMAMLEVCISQANAASGLVLKSAPDDSSHPLDLDHCSLCVMHASVLGLPPQPQATPLLTTLSDIVPSLFLHAPSPPHVWAVALARAPPAHLA
jgi:Protein of unknown function (DUF2946)